MKIAIYGAGKVCQRLAAQGCFENYDIVGVYDKNQEKQGEKLAGFLIEEPDKLKNKEYDYILICTGEKAFCGIVQELQDKYQIPRDKIVLYAAWMNERHELLLYTALQNDAVKYKVTNILDFSNKAGKKRYYLQDGRIYFWNISEKNQYPDLLKNTEASWLGNTENDRLDELKALICELPKRHIIYMEVPYRVEIQTIEQELKAYGKISVIQLTYTRILRIVPEMSDAIGIYVATHKLAHMPEGDIYVPIWLGDVENTKNYLSEKQGDNIAYLNSKINECTAMYWIWKNSTYDIVGLVHYRRFFVREQDGKRLEKEDIRQILSHYDMVIAKPYELGEDLEKQIINDTKEEELYYKVKELAQKYIALSGEHYLTAFHEIMQQNIIYPCNMFIAPKEIFDRYCEWLFPIIIPVAEQTDVAAYDAYSSRMVGFLAERLFNVWLSEQNYRVKAMPFIVTDV